MSDGLKILLVFLAGAIIVLLFISVLGGRGTMGAMGQMMSGGMMGGGLFGILFMLLSEGKIVRVGGVLDALGLFQQTGAIPSPEHLD